MPYSLSSGQESGWRNGFYGRKFADKAGAPDRDVQAQKIGIVAVILIKAVEAGLFAEQGRVTDKIEDQDNV